MQVLIRNMQSFRRVRVYYRAVVLLAYVPGKLLLIALKRTLSPLEDVTLACVFSGWCERACLLVNDVCSSRTFLPGLGC